jgi:hypothetical protein
MIRRLLMLAPICLTFGCMTSHAVSRNQWYTCEYYCFGSSGVLEATSSGGVNECICIDGTRYPYPVKDDELLEKFIESLEKEEGKI